MVLNKKLKLHIFDFSEADRDLALESWSNAPEHVFFRGGVWSSARGSLKCSGANVGRFQVFTVSPNPWKRAYVHCKCIPFVEHLKNLHDTLLCRDK
jgi:hypothetical protein